MKKLFIGILSATFLVTSCNDLEVQDKANLPIDAALADLAGFQTVLNAAYESVNDFGYYGQTMMIAPEIMADNMRLAQLTGRYELEYVNAQNSGINIWANRYSAINECNIVIGRIDELPASAATDAQKTSLKSQALFLRALFYHDLARVYGYEPGREVNSFESSVVLKLAPTFGLSDVVNVPRATNDDVYEQIEADLLAAIPGLPTVAAGSAGAIFANANAARLLLARVYLYWGRMADAANYAQQVINGSGTDLVAPANYLASWGDAAFPIHPESLFESEIRTLDWNTVDGANNSLHSLLMNNTGGSQFIIVASDELISTIQADAEDIRIGMFNTETIGREFNKWRGQGGTPFRENIPVLRLSEAYLIAAEALGAGAGDAIFNAYRARRGMTTVLPASVDNILRERRVEFMAEGHRFFDLKRLGRDVTKPAAAGVPTLPYADFRMLPRIPQSEINLSQGVLVQNPGYN